MIKLSSHSYRIFLRFVLFFVFGSIFPLVYYTKQLLHNEIHQDFINATKNINTLAIGMQMLDLACQQNVANEEIFLNIKETLTNFSPTFMTIPDKLGKLISPTTYCEINQFITESQQVLMTKNFCPIIITISDAQVSQLTQRLNQDEHNVHIYKEFFTRKRYQKYSSTICNNIP